MAIQGRVMAVYTAHALMMGAYLEAKAQSEAQGEEFEGKITGLEGNLEELQKKVEHVLQRKVEVQKEQGPQTQLDELQEKLEHVQRMKRELEGKETPHILNLKVFQASAKARKM